MGSTRPNPTHAGWVGLGWTYVMGWVGSNFFWPTMVGRVKKFPQPDPTRPMHTPTWKYSFKLNMIREPFFSPSSRF